MLRPGIIEMNIGVYINCIMFDVVFNYYYFKIIIKREPNPILTYQYSFMSLFTFFVALFYWETPSYMIWSYMFLSAICGTVFHIALNYSYKLVDLSATQPITFFGLIWGSLLGYYVFNDRPDFFLLG